MRQGCGWGREGSPVGEGGGRQVGLLVGESQLRVRVSKVGPVLALQIPTQLQKASDIKLSITHFPHFVPHPIPTIVDRATIASSHQGVVLGALLATSNNLLSCKKHAKIQI